MSQPTQKMVSLYYDLEDGDKVNFVCMHPIRWAELIRKYGMSEDWKEFGLVGMDTDAE